MKLLLALRGTAEGTVSDIFIYLKKKELFHKTGTTYSVVLKM